MGVVDDHIVLHRIGDADGDDRLFRPEFFQRAGSSRRHSRAGIRGGQRRGVAQAAHRVRRAAHPPVDAGCPFPEWWASPAASRNSRGWPSARNGQCRCPAFACKFAEQRPRVDLALIGIETPWNVRTVASLGMDAPSTAPPHAFQAVMGGIAPGHGFGAGGFLEGGKRVHGTRLARRARQGSLKSTRKVARPPWVRSGSLLA